MRNGIILLGSAALLACSSNSSVTIGPDASYDGTCIGTLFSCFHPTGTCTETGTSGVDTFDTTWQWTDGSSVEEHFVNVGYTDLTVTGTGGGRACAEVKRDFGVTATTWDFVDGSGAIVATGREDSSGNVLVTCMDGSTVMIDVPSGQHLFSVLPPAAAEASCTPASPDGGMSPDGGVAGDGGH